MTNISVYYDVYKSAFVYNTTGKPLIIEDYPVIRYKEYKTIEWNIGYWNNSTLAFTAIDLTAFNVTAWQSALDYDFSTGTDPMIVSSNSMIDATDAATGKIVVTYDADNSDFLAAVNGQSNGARYCYIDLNGLDASAHNVFSASPTNVQVIAKMQIAPGADPSGPSASLYYTKVETDALLADVQLDGGNISLANSATGNIILFDKTQTNACKFVMVFSDTVYENRLEAVITIEDDDSIIPHSIETDYNSGEEISISYTLDLSGNNVRFNLTNSSGNTLTGDYQVFELADSGLGARVNNFIWKGAWSGATTYNEGEAVSSGGSSYISNVDDNLNHEPPNASYWDLLCSGTPVSITANRIAISDGAGAITASAATATEAGYLSGVSSNIQTQLDGKVDENVAISGATKTKITYDAKGLITSGADATTADIADSSDKRYVTDAQLVVIGNTSGTNTGDSASAPATHASQHTNGTDNIQMASAAQIGLMSIAQASAVDTATNANTASTIVKRDGSGNFSAGTITANLTGNISGNAATVTTNANLTGTVTSVGNVTSIASNAIKANMLQSTASDLGAANITIDLSNSNGTYVTNLTTDGTITTVNMKYTNAAMFGTAINSDRGINCSLSVTDPANGLSGMYAEIKPTYTGAETVSENVNCLYFDQFPIINTSHNNSGTLSIISGTILRNLNAVDSDDSGTLAVLRGSYFGYGHYNRNVSATPQTTNVYGIYLSPYYKTGTISNLYDIFIKSDNTGGTVTTAWSYYQENTRKNYFGGNIGIGITPTAKLHVAAGSATASTAPLKFTSGTLLSSPEAGAEEFLTDDRYVTITTGAARKGYILNDGTKLTSGRVPFATTNGRLTDDADLTFSGDTLLATIVGTATIKTDTSTATDLTLTTGTAKTLVLGTPVYDDLMVYASGVRLGATDYPSWVDYKGGQVLSFSKTATNKIYFNVQLPHSYKTGTDIEFHIHIAYPSNGSGNSIWYMTYSWANINGTFPAESNSGNVSIASPTTTDAHKIAELIATIDGHTEAKGISSYLICSLSRIGGDGSDTFDDVIYFLGADFHFQKDTIGSRTATVK
jgi:hypothetical protein